ncbi:MAG: hypothetical protein CM15mP74_33800 [Halieaceae bacterium]|nr:MAG: hypothetical protein CM15mP74_33800 [Halieaceae bacterium]
MEELASHGYIVYSVAHTYDGPEGVFPNGDPIPEDDKLWEGARWSRRSQAARLSIR